MELANLVGPDTLIIAIPVIAGIIVATVALVRSRGAISTKPGWHPDPFGRYESRFWDGTRWTSQARTDGVVSEDSMLAE